MQLKAMVRVSVRGRRVRIMDWDAAWNYILWQIWLGDVRESVLEEI